MNLEKLTEDVCSLVIETGDFIHREMKHLKAEDVETKGLHNFVTYVDKSSEELLIRRLSGLLPGSGFIAEENDRLNSGEYTWVIDPLDGTTNFIHGVPLYSISIGLLHGDNILLGVIYEINQKECFYTWQSAPSFLNQEPVKVSSAKKLADSLLATGFPYYDYGKLDEYMNLFRYLMQHSRGIRRLGSAAADMAYVACGRFDGFYEYGLSPWDVCAGALLVKNAGGLVSDFKGGQNYLFGKEMIATNLSIYNELLNLFDSWKPAIG